MHHPAGETENARCVVSHVQREPLGLIFASILPSPREHTEMVAPLEMVGDYNCRQDVVWVKKALTLPHLGQVSVWSPAWGPLCVPGAQSQCFYFK
jgi:hypothetical protein